MESIRQDMTQLMAEFVESPLTSFKDLANASRIALALYRLNKEQFPFYDPQSDMCIQVRKSSDPMTIYDYNHENRKVWTILTNCLSSVAIDGWPNIIEEFRTKYMDKAIEGDEDALEYFWLVFFEFLSKANYLVFKKFEDRYNKITSRLREIAQDSASKWSGSKQNITGSHLSNDYRLVQRSPGPSNDRSVQDLLQIVNDRDVCLQVLREDLISKERENSELRDKVASLRVEKKNLHEQLAARDAHVERLQFKIDKLELAVDDSFDKDDRIKIIMSQAKIDELYREIDELQKKSSYLQRRNDDLLMAQHQGQGPRLELVESEDRHRSEVTTLSLEIDLLRDKVKILEEGSENLTNKLLKQKEQYNRLLEQIEEYSKMLAQKEINIKALMTEKESLVKYNLHLRDQLILKETQCKGLEKEYSKIIESGEKMARSPYVSHEQATDDSVLELVKVCKEVNRCYKEELMCLYNLLHDHFVNQLTGTSLEELVKKRLAERNREKLIN